MNAIRPPKSHWRRKREKKIAVGYVRVFLNTRNEKRSCLDGAPWRAARCDPNLPQWCVSRNDQISCNVPSWCRERSKTCMHGIVFWPSGRHFYGMQTKFIGGLGKNIQKKWSIALLSAKYVSYAKNSMRTHKQRRCCMHIAREVEQSGQHTFSTTKAHQRGKTI